MFTAVLVSAFWIWFYNFVPASPPSVARSGNLVTVKPDKAFPVVIAEQVVVGPGGLAIPVTGIKPDQLNRSMMSELGTEPMRSTLWRQGDARDRLADGTIENCSQRLGRNNGPRTVSRPSGSVITRLSAPAGLMKATVRRGQVIARVGHTGDAAQKARISICDQADGEQKRGGGTPIGPVAAPETGQRLGERPLLRDAGSTGSQAPQDERCPSFAHAEEALSKVEVPSRSTIQFFEGVEQ